MIRVIPHMTTSVGVDMNRQEITQKYQKLCAYIEDRFSGGDIPMDVQIFYLTCELISLQNFRSFYKRYGGIHLDPDFADVGKQEWLNLPPLTEFERDSCILYNRFVNENDRKSISTTNY